MAKTFAELLNDIQQELQDTTPTYYTDAEVTVQLPEAIIEVSEYKPRKVMETFELETRTGAATSSTSGALIDGDESQFRSSDVNKVIFNTTDRTWAIVTAYVSATQLTLSKDIMASGEKYEMFNQDCWDNKQIYLGDVEDYVGPDHGVVTVEFRTNRSPRELRNFTVEGNILTVDFEFTPVDSKSANLDSREVEVYVWINKRHQVSQMTDLALAVDLPGDSYAAGTTTIHVDSTADETMEEDTEFTVAGLRGVYKLTQATTFATNEGDITFWPPLESAIDDDDVVTVKGSTLDRSLERMVIELCAGRCAMSKASKYLQRIETAITSISNVTTALGLAAAKTLRQVTDLASARTALGLAPGLLIEANSEIDKMAAEVTQAIATLDTARALINTVTVGGIDVPRQYADQVSRELDSSRGALETARGFLAQAASEGPLASSYVDLGTGELQGAASSVANAIGFLQKITSDLAIADRAPTVTRWGRDKVRDVLGQLQRGLPPKQRFYYPKD
ncbi:hypothetical protein LCGC14_1242710 [marine sediment metagenome]|uniref:Uncharacterized protein n=1 Tax=marine sediment metagenome TaxID=412755 RepID=A0A0F9L5D6_9ZZZZ